MSEDNIIVVSADCHAGATLSGYRPYLEKSWLDEFDAWVASYDDPIADLSDIYGDRNWNSPQRLRHLEEDGVVAEVIYPNTAAPFHPVPADLAAPPSRAEYDRRRAGARAHNRWLADLCADVPGRRAGIAEILFNNPDDAIADLKEAQSLKLFGGIMMPPMPPGSSIPPVWDESYAPIWAYCEEHGIPVNHHGGGGTPDLGYGKGIPRLVYLSDFVYFSNRIIWHMCWGGVFERHPALKFVITEQGFGSVLDQMWGQDGLYAMLKGAGDDSGCVAARELVGDFIDTVPRKPSDYILRNCAMGASFLGARDVARRHEIGVNRIMWGADYPHTEATWPNSRGAIAAAVAGLPEADVRAIVGLNALEFYGFDRSLLQEAANRVGPKKEEILTPQASGAAAPVRSVAAQP